MRPVYVAVLAAVILSAGVTVWLATTDSGSGRGPGSGVAALLPASERPETAYLYFSDPENVYLRAEAMALPVSGTSLERGQMILDKLIAGPAKGDLIGTLPPGTAVRNFFIDPAQRVAYVDFTAAVRDAHPGGCLAEMATVYSVVNSLALNLTDVDAVKLLIDGADVESLAGHMDLRFAFRPDVNRVR